MLLSVAGSHPRGLFFVATTPTQQKGHQEGEESPIAVELPCHPITVMQSAFGLTHTLIVRHELYYNGA